MSSERKNSDFITAPGAIAISFAVLLQGVTNGDVLKHPGSQIYTASAILLALGGFSFSMEDRGGYRNEKLLDFVGFTKAHRVSALILSIACDLAIQIVAVRLGWLMCKQAGESVANAFFGTLVVGFVLYGAPLVLLHFLGVPAVLARRSLTKRGNPIPPWLDVIIELNGPDRPTKSD